MSREGEPEGQREQASDEIKRRLSPWRVQLLQILEKAKQEEKKPLATRESGSQDETRERKADGE